MEHVFYCPNLNVPQSYTPKSPVVMRAMEVKYDAYKQVRNRLKAFKAMNHPTDKVELIIMGGTFLEYPEEFQHEFIKDCYDGLNNTKSESLEEAQKKNETEKHRCVALCVETRPDVCIKHIKKMRDWGVTRVELGVQIIDDKIYKKIKRGHTVQDVVDATEALRNAGFKVGYHIMPNLPGSNIKKDLELFKKLFSDERFKPDQLKLYPCQVMPGSELEKMYWKKKYQPYRREKIEKVLIEMLKLVPRYCRVMRVMREIPPEYLVAGTIRIDLSKEIENELRKKKNKLKEIRYREIGFALRRLAYPKLQNSGVRDKRKINLDLKLKITKYKAAKGDEYFLEVVNKDDILFGLLRLRILTPKGVSQGGTRTSSRHQGGASSSSSPSVDEDITLKSVPSTQEDINVEGNTEGKAIIREIHVYGQSLKLGEKGEVSQHSGLLEGAISLRENAEQVQHKGLGKWLMNEAEKIVQGEKIKELSVISGIGVREYYKKLGYSLKDTYMVKNL